jgi:IclR family transcriptional regulator, acetate operon repressor
VQSADRALRILSSFDGGRGSLGVTEVAQELGIHKSTVSRLMAALEQRGFVRREGERFVPGLELARLARTADPVLPLVERALPVMERLASATGEAVTLGVPHGSRVEYVAQRDGGHIVGVADWTKRSTTIHASASGKVLLAFAGARLPETLERHTPRTIVDPSALEREVARTRLRGYAQIRDELEVGLTAVAAPVFDRTGACVAALGVSGPSFRLGRLLAALGERCLQAADDVTTALSGVSTDQRGPLTSKTSGAHA